MAQEPEERALRPDRAQRAPRTPFSRDPKGSAPSGRDHDRRRDHDQSRDRKGAETPSRRTILRACATVGSVAATSAPCLQTWAAASQPAGSDGDPEPLPTNVLGKTGVKVTRLTMGASFPDYGTRLLRFAYQQGIRIFDNSHRYMNGKAEEELGTFVRTLGRRDDAFVISKGKTFDPGAFYPRVTAALERMQLDTIDLFMVHGIDDPGIPLDRGGDWRRLKDRLIREKKVRFMGFSCHTEMPQRTAALVNAAKGGWIDAVLVACDPGLIRSDDAFNKALDVCAKADIGLMCMKTTRGLGRATHQPADARDAFQRLGLSPHHAMYHAMWSDGRFATVCTEMPNRRFIEENAAAARQFKKPFDADQWNTLDEGVQKLSRATCPGCDGACRRAAGTPTDFCSITRYLAYAEEDGKRDRARELFAALPPEQRDWASADLHAASRACPARLDFGSLLTRAGSTLA